MAADGLAVAQAVAGAVVPHLDHVAAAVGDDDFARRAGRVGDGDGRGIDQRDLSTGGDGARVRPPAAPRLGHDAVKGKPVAAVGVDRARREGAVGHLVGGNDRRQVVVQALVVEPGGVGKDGGLAVGKVVAVGRAGDDGSGDADQIAVAVVSQRDGPPAIVTDGGEAVVPVVSVGDGPPQRVGDGLQAAAPIVGELEGVPVAVGDGAQLAGGSGVAQGVVDLDAPVAVGERDAGGFADEGGVTAGGRGKVRSVERVNVKAPGAFLPAQGAAVRGDETAVIVVLPAPAQGAVVD